MFPKFAVRREHHIITKENARYQSWIECNIRRKQMNENQDTRHNWKTEEWLSGSQEEVNPHAKD